MDRWLMVDAKNMGELEARIAACGTSLAELMRRAGSATAQETFESVGGPAAVLVLAGAGNNGGDGWVAAARLAARGCTVVLATPVAPGDLKAEPARSEALRVADAVAGGSLGRLRILVNPSINDLRAAALDASCVIDAMLGIGFSGSELREPYGAWASLANEAHEAGAFVLAADVPSGLNAQTGVACGQAVRADATVTMIACKPGLLTMSARPYVGRLVCADLGVAWDARSIARRAGMARDFASVLEAGLLQRVERYVDESLEIPEPPVCGSAVEPFCMEKSAAVLESASYSRPMPRFAPAMASSAAVESAADTFNLGDLLDELDESFSTTLLRLIDERGLEDVQVYKRAHMSRQLFSKIRSTADYRPTKKTVLALAIALELTLDETKLLLERAGFALSHASKADLIVEFFIVNGVYDLFAVNEALFALDQPLL